MSLNPKSILKLLCLTFEDPVYNTESRITDEERLFSSQLTDLIKDAINFDVFKETNDTLSFTDSVIPDVTLIEEEPENISEVMQEDEEFREFVDIDYKKKAIEFWRSGKKRRRSIETVQHKFKKIINTTQLYRWERQIAEGDSRTDKLLYISQYVLDQFNSASNRNLSIHDLDLKRWSLKAKEEVHLSPQLFTASSKWIHNFKIQYSIVCVKENKQIWDASAYFK